MGRKRHFFVDENFIENIDSQDKAYFLGFMYADGYNNQKGNYIAITLKDCDIDILEKINNLFKSEAPLRVRSHKNGNSYAYLQISSKKICSDLAKLGCPQNKGQIIRFPFWMNKALWSHFIRGYFDGDGGISTSKPVRGHTSYRMNIVSNPDFIEDLNSVFKEILDTKYYILKSRKHKFTTQIRVEGNLAVKKLCDFIYNDSHLHLNRKYLKYLELKNYKPKQRKTLFVYELQSKNFIGEFPSYFSASKNLGISRETISNNMTGKNKSLKYIFSNTKLNLL